jgi:hypothetical protein
LARPAAEIEQPVGAPQAAALSDERDQVVGVGRSPSEVVPCRRLESARLEGNGRYHLHGILECDGGEAQVRRLPDRVGLP